MATYEKITKREHIYLDKYGNQHSTLEEALAADKRLNNAGLAERTGENKGNERETQEVKE